MNERTLLNRQLAQMLKGGVIMDVTTPEQARIAEAAGVPVPSWPSNAIPADIRAAGGVSRMSDPKMIRGIQEAVSIPVMAKCRVKWSRLPRHKSCRPSRLTTSTRGEVLSPRRQYLSY